MKVSASADSVKQQAGRLAEMLEAQGGAGVLEKRKQQQATHEDMEAALMRFVK